MTIKIPTMLDCDPLKEYLASVNVGDNSQVDAVTALQIINICLQHDYGFHFQHQEIWIHGGLSNYDY